MVYSSIASLLFYVLQRSSSAGTNRAPFDVPEAEAQSVSGFNVILCCMRFALFCVLVNDNMLSMSSLCGIQTISSLCGIQTSAALTRVNAAKV